jgi:hypothetical protein
VRRPPRAHHPSSAIKQALVVASIYAPDGSHKYSVRIAKQRPHLPLFTRAWYGYQRKAVCVKRLAGAWHVVCPCIAVMGLVPAACNRVGRRRAGLPMMRGEVAVGFLNAAWGLPRPSA